MTTEWRRVSKTEPCPVCGHPDWCSVSANGEICCCMRQESSRSTRNGGWLHILAERTKMPFYRKTTPSRIKPSPSKVDWGAYLRALRGSWDSVMLDGLAMSLGVDDEALDRLMPAYDIFRRAWIFPMRDGLGNVVGFRVRNIFGKKWAVTGSREGLFFDCSIEGAEEIAICEGPTDTAAALSIGLVAVGRSSCSSGLDHLRALCSAWRVRRTTIIADNDRYKPRPDGTFWKPGLEGAESLARSLGRIYRVVVPPCKDMREWYAGGRLTLKEFNEVANCQIWRLPK